MSAETGAARAVKPALAAGLALLAAWLFSPMLDPVHVEGFTATIASIALHLTHDALANYDQLFPFNLQFFAFSRLGTNLFVAGLVGPLDLPAEWAMHLTMWTGFALLAGSSYVLVRRWTEAPPLVVAAVMVLTPGLAETGFFYNDNMLASGLAATALMLLTVSARPAATLGAGLAYGCAVLARTDCLLLAPAAALVIWRREGLNGRWLAHCAGFGLVSAGLASAVLAAFGLNPLLVLRIAAHAVALWRRLTPWEIQPFSLLFFAGPITLGLALLGLVGLARERKVYLLLLLLGVPLLYNLVYLNKVWEARQLAPLTPFILSAGALGLAPLVSPGSDRRLQLLIGVLAALVLFIPPPPPILAEGPRNLVGRAWGVVDWWRWQAAARASYDRIGDFVAQAPAPVSVIVTDYWDGDRYTHLQLQEHGFTPFDVARAYPGCAGVAEGFQKGAARVVHLRLHMVFLADGGGRIAARLLGPGRACLANVAAPQVTFVTALSRMDRLFGDAAPDTPWVEASRAMALPYFDPMTGVPLTPPLLAALPQAAQQDYLAWLKSRPDEVASFKAHPVSTDLSALR